MNALEANVLITKIALLDRWFKKSPVEQADMAGEWAEVLADVSLDAALKAVREHYATETRSVMPADILAAVPAWKGVSDAGNVTERRLAESRRGIAS